MKRTLSADQQAKRDARRAQFKLLVKALANIPDLQRVQIANKFGLRTVEGRELSLCNTMLCYMQNPTASMVGGFRQWIKQGRAVRKGEHGIMIWCPTGCKKDGESTPMRDATLQLPLRAGYWLGRAVGVSCPLPATSTEARVWAGGWMIDLRTGIATMIGTERN